MDKELEELFDKLFDKIFDNIGDKFKETKNKMEKALNEPCEISIKMYDGGKVEVKSEGRRLSILMALTNLEKSLLKELKCDEKMFEMLKEISSTKKIDDVEVL